MGPPECLRLTCGHELDAHEDGDGACSSCGCPAYEAACMYCGDTGTVLVGDSAEVCGACFELDFGLRGQT